MSGKSELVKLRVSTDEKLVWEKAAGVMTLSAWMREACNTAARLGGPEVDNRTVSAGQREVRGDMAEVVSVPPTTSKASHVTAKRVRSGMCPHRLRAEQYCWRCD